MEGGPSRAALHVSEWGGRGPVHTRARGGDRREVRSRSSRFGRAAADSSVPRGARGAIFARGAGSDGVVRGRRGSLGRGEAPCARPWVRRPTPAGSRPECRVRRPRPTPRPHTPTLATHQRPRRARHEPRRRPNGRRGFSPLRQPPGEAYWYRRRAARRDFADGRERRRERRGYADQDRVARAAETSPRRFASRRSRRRESHRVSRAHGRRRRAATRPFRSETIAARGRRRPSADDHPPTTIRRRPSARRLEPLGDSAPNPSDGDSTRRRRATRGEPRTTRRRSSHSRAAAAAASRVRSRGPLGTHLRCVVDDPSGGSRRRRGVWSPVRR